MKRNISYKWVIIAVLVIAFSIVSSNSLIAQPKILNAYLSYSTFYSAETGPYIETYLSVDGKSIEFKKNENGKFQGDVQVIMIFRIEDEIVNYGKYELNSPELDDTLDVNISFMDQQRYLLKNGNYEFEIQLWDVNSNSKPFISLNPIQINYPDDEITVSGIQLVESFTKSVKPGILTKGGYDLIPYITNFFPEQVQKISFYSEIYNTDKVLGEDGKYLLKYYLEYADNGKHLPNYTVYKKESAKPVNIVFSEFDISNLRSGNYFLAVEARDKQNNALILNKVFIQRSNPKLKLKIEDLAVLNVDNSFVSNITSIDTIRQYIYYTYPIANLQEQNFSESHCRTGDMESLQQYFYMFWMERNELEPEKAWLSYLNEIKKVNYAYSTPIEDGYETDRGRAYLKYGPPSAISESYNEPGTYPYEIWHYYVLGNGQRDRRFIFFTRDIATNDFALLHSDVSGELSNYRWQDVIYQRVSPNYDITRDAETDKAWGGNSKKYFDLPR